MKQVLLLAISGIKEGIVKNQSYEKAVMIRDIEREVIALKNVTERRMNLYLRKISNLTEDIEFTADDKIGELVDIPEDISNIAADLLKKSINLQSAGEEALASAIETKRKAFKFLHNTVEEFKHYNISFDAITRKAIIVSKKQS